MDRALRAVWSFCYGCSVQHGGSYKLLFVHTTRLVIACIASVGRSKVKVNACQAS
jgi:hypothetical protein